MSLTIGCMETLRLASLWSRALAGAKAIPVAVEVHLGNGLPQFQIVGLADTEVQESRERVRVALQTCGFEFPQRRITVNLAPADLPKRSGHFDLPIALGLLIASAKTSYDTQSAQIQQMTANVILLDGVLARYGADAQPARTLLRRMAPASSQIWHRNDTASAKAAPFVASGAADGFYDAIEQLAPRNDIQRSLQARAIRIANDIAQTRLMVFAQPDDAIPMPFLAVLVLWLTIIFISFSLFVRPNATVIAALFVCALSAATSIFLILELSQPFAGLIRISTEPLVNALAPLGP